MPEIQQITVVGGCGHVGLPLGIVLAERNVGAVTLYDIDPLKVASVAAGNMPFREKDADEALRRVLGKNLKVTTDAASLRTADVVITVIGTPVDRYLNPTVNDFLERIDPVISAMRDGTLLVLRSTVVPGLTRRLHDRIASRERRIDVAFCPERIAEGRALEELCTLPQIVSAFTPEAMGRAGRLFSAIAPSVIELTPPEAELAKLFTNSWRYLNFAISNQFYVLAQSVGLDFYRIYQAITQDYPRMKSFARPGFAAGPCLLKDTLQLSAFSANSFFMGHAAMLVNEGLPNFIVSQLRTDGLAHKTVAILGMAFKGESDDDRDSLSHKLKKLLETEASEVLCSDPYVQRPDLTPAEQAIAKADIIILGAPHSVYRDLIIPEGKRVIDVWNFWCAQATAKPQALAAGRG